MLNRPPVQDIFRAPFEVLPGTRDRRLLILCDHASNALPKDYALLGLPEAEFERHIAYDIGAAGVVRRLAEILGANAVLSGFSRLLIDPNRGPDDPTLVMRLSDGSVIPGNARIGPEEVTKRMQAYYEPYHAAITGLIDEALDLGDVPVLVSIHSFTPSWKGVPRRWQAGLLWDKDPRLAGPLIEELKAEGLVTGDNEPYDGALENDTMYRHGTLRGLPHALIEVRQDLISEPDGQAEWAERLARMLTSILKDPALSRIEHFGSRVGHGHTAPPNDV
ncbi:N-formylglutamate amidohydrolase [Terrihabitans soli]|uniref:N-formylglutamate amidohydrolase n=1 Tax=Terrihabitans soli TaxID=708113 RepID=A0A6S6QS10_9HYPH|nr:N-formylglutamate amidohydrolase [Terrihabitans soli]BCJ89821.1 N-formylglutamate amidohydrolase [Terrihabitans soli]